MSLLLDALQRASKEKEKAAAAPPSPEVIEPTLQPLSAPESPVAADLSLAPVTPRPMPEAPRLEPRAAAPVSPEPLTRPAESPPPSPRPAAIAETANRLKPPPAIPVPPPSPRVAREILKASGQGADGGSGNRLIIVGVVILLVIAGIGGFVFLQMRPSSGIAIPPSTPLANAPATTPSPALSPAAPTPTSPPVTSAPSATEPSATPATAPAATGLPAVGVATATPTPVAVTVATTATPPKKNDEPTPSASQRPRRAPPVKPLISARPGVPGPLEAAYAALLEGRLDTAAVSYRLALRHNPNERDALLGLAHIAHRQGQREEARGYYQRVVRLDPENPTATAGLLALQAEGDPQNSIGRARDMTERNPGSAAAFALLGNAQAREGRVADAQQSFFQAFSLEPGNAQYAYNLAVALDRLHKYEQARSYYERAIALAEKSTRGTRQLFPLDDAQDRLLQLRLRAMEN